MSLRRALLIGTIAAWTTFTPRSATALCMGSFFEEQVRQAQIIFVGTATTIDVMRYRFDAVRYVKGQGPADSLLLVQWDGDDGVSFRSGARYVVFATKGHWPAPDQYQAMPCGTGHPFGVWPDSGSAIPVVHMSSGNSLAAFDGTHLVFLLDRPWRPEFGVWAIDEFGRRNPSVPPPRQPLPDLIRAADTEIEYKSRGSFLTPEQTQAASRRVRTVILFPHQDPGVRVTEEEFLRTLSTVIESVADSSRGAGGELH